MSKSKRKAKTKTVAVVWEHEYGRPEIKTHSFATEAELQAFIEGVTTTDPSGEWYHICRYLKEAIEYLRDSGRGEFCKEKDK